MNWIASGKVTAGGDARVAPALHIRGQAITHDDRTASVGGADIIEDVVEVSGVGLARADLLADIDAVHVGCDAGAGIAARLGDGQAVGGEVYPQAGYGSELLDKVQRAREQKAAPRQLILIHRVDRGEVYRIGADALKEHLEAQRLELVACDVAALERLPAPQVAVTVYPDDLVGRLYAESAQGSADGGLLSELEVIDGLVGVKENDIVSARQSRRPPL